MSFRNNDFSPFSFVTDCCLLWIGLKKVQDFPKKRTWETHDRHALLPILTYITTYFHKSLVTLPF